MKGISSKEILNRILSDEHNYNGHKLFYLKQVLKIDLSSIGNSSETIVNQIN